MQQNLIDAARAAFEFEMLQENIIDDEGLERDDDTGEYIDEPAAAAWKAWIVANDKAARASRHPDDVAVDRFALAMKAKLADARAKGRSGWDDPAQCSVGYLAQLLVGHLTKTNAGNFEDVANLAMMLHQRGADPSVLAEAAREKLASAQPLPNYPAVPEGWALVKSPITEDMHRAAVKVLVRANGVDGLPQRMLDAMLAAAPAQVEQQAPAITAEQIIELLAQEWDKEDPDDTIDIGDVGANIRKAGARLLAEAKGVEA